MPGREDSCVCCPFGCYATIPIAFSILAWFITLPATFYCEFFVLGNGSESRGLGYWTLEDIENDEDDACTEWEKEQEDFFDGVWKFGRGSSILLILLGGVLVCAGFGSCCFRTPALAAKIMGSGHIMMGLFSILLLVGLSSKICDFDPCDTSFFPDATCSRDDSTDEQPPSSCSLSYGSFATILTCFFWLISGTSLFFLERNKRPTSRELQQQFMPGDDYNHPEQNGEQVATAVLEPIHLDVSETAHPDGRITRRTAYVRTNPDGTTTVEHDRVEEIASPHNHTIPLDEENVPPPIVAKVLEDSVPTAAAVTAVPVLNSLDEPANVASSSHSENATAVARLSAPPSSEPRSVAAVPEATSDGMVPILTAQATSLSSTETPALPPVSPSSEVTDSSQEGAASGGDTMNNPISDSIETSDEARSLSIVSSGLNSDSTTPTRSPEDPLPPTADATTQSSEDPLPPTADATTTSAIDPEPLDTSNDVQTAPKKEEPPVIATAPAAGVTASVTDGNSLDSLEVPQVEEDHAVKRSLLTVNETPLDVSSDLVEESNATVPSAESPADPVDSYSEASKGELQVVNSQFARVGAPSTMGENSLNTSEVEATFENAKAGETLEEEKSGEIVAASKAPATIGPSHDGRCAVIR